MITIKVINLFLVGLRSIGIFSLTIIKYFIKGLIIVITIFPKYFIIGLLTVFRKKNKTVSKNKKFTLPIIIMMILSFIVYLIAVFLFSRWYVQSLKTKYLVSDIEKFTSIISEEEGTTEIVKENSESESNDTQDSSYSANDYYDYIYVPFVNVNFYELLNINNDTVGWLKVNNTNVNYPVVQTTNNKYYLTHDYNKSYNANGWIYGDYRCDFTNYGKNNIIYGHNLFSRTMFGSLTWTLKSSWYTNNENQYIKMSSPSYNTIWKIFSIYVVESESYYLRTKFDNDTDYLDFLNTIKGRSVYNFETTVNANDKILTLSTCTDDGVKRIVIHAKLTDITNK